MYWDVIYRSAEGPRRVVEIEICYPTRMTEEWQRMSTLWKLESQELVITTTYGATSDDKGGIMTPLSLQWILCIYCEIAWCTLWVKIVCFVFSHTSGLLSEADFRRRWRSPGSTSLSSCWPSVSFAPIAGARTGSIATAIATGTGIATVSIVVIVAWSAVSVVCVSEVTAGHCLIPRRRRQRRRPCLLQPRRQSWIDPMPSRSCLDECGILPTTRGRRSLSMGNWEPRGTAMGTTRRSYETSWEPCKLPLRQGRKQKHRKRKHQKRKFRLPRRQMWMKIMALVQRNMMTICGRRDGESGSGEFIYIPLWRHTFLDDVMKLFAHYWPFVRGIYWSLVEITGHLWGESTGYRWTPLTKGP